MVVLSISFAVFTNYYVTEGVRLSPKDSTEQVYSQPSKLDVLLSPDKNIEDNFLKANNLNKLGEDDIVVTQNSSGEPTLGPIRNLWKKIILILF